MPAVTVFIEKELIAVFSDEYSGLISFRMDWFDLLAVQGTLKSLLHPLAIPKNITCFLLL